MVGARTALVLDRCGAARKDYGLWAQSADQGVVHLVEGMDLAIDIHLAQTTGDQLGYLAAEIDDQTGLVRGSGGHWGPGMSAHLVAPSI